MNDMRESEYQSRVRYLEQKIAFNERIHCPYVAAKWKRELERLKQRFEGKNVK